jgi:outer membrane receptor protein involved in Fe transport
VDRYEINDATKLSPRAGLTFHLHPNLDLSATYGRYYQNPALVFMKAHPANAALRPIRADHYVAGMAFRPRPDLKISVEGYSKRYFDYPVSTQFRSLSGADTGEEVDISHLLLPYSSDGRGRADGVELHAHKKLSGRVWGQVSYACSRTENRALDGLWRSSTFDLPHVLSIVAGVKATRSIDLSTKLTYTSGRPTTPLLPESYEQNRMILDLTRTNSERATAYHRLDLRLDRRQTHRWGNLISYLEIDNVYNHENVLFYDWNPKTRQRHLVPQLAFMVLGGMNVEF